jgi:hypothetical protein
MAFSKRKALLRKAATRTVDDLWDAIAKTSMPSHQPNAPITLQPLDMTRIKSNPL